jgi:F-type H+-transporting ATPase subunit epsilon
VAVLDVHLVAPEREVWSGSAQMVIAHGVEGDVGILPGHAPLLIRLPASAVRIQQEDGTWTAAAVDGGFLHVTSGEEGTRVDVLATGAELATEVDRSAAEAQVRELEQRLQGAEDDDAREALARARVRANLPG